MTATHLIPSRRPGLTYRVVEGRNGISCDCLSFRYAGDRRCKHTDLVQLRALTAKVVKEARTDAHRATARTLSEALAAAERGDWDTARTILAARVEQVAPQRNDRGVLQ